MQSFVIKSNDAGQRLDKFLKKSVSSLPKSLMYKYIRLKRIKVNGKRAAENTVLQENDVVDLYINDGFFVKRKDVYQFLDAPPVASFIYEDDNILIADKRPGLVVHEDDENSTDTLINRIRHYLYKKGEYDPGNEHSFAPALVNRIDRNTGGLVMAVKNADSLRILNQKIKNREVDKHYLCIAHGIFSKKSGVLTGYLKKDSNKNKVFVRRERFEDAKEIITKYRVLEEKDHLSLLEVELLTGRTHQIRAHLASVGHPLLGDGKYGANQLNKGTGFNFQALYSYKLRFAFKTDAGALSYLNNRTFQVDDVWFLKYF